jgi:flavodoxin I
MKVLIVYDSFFGNTERIAQAIGRALGAREATDLVKAGVARPERLAGIDLLLVGSPTRGFRPTPAVTGFLKGLPREALTGVKVAAFDTGIAPEDIPSGALRFMVKLAGYAAKPIAGLLRKKGGELVLPPEGFWVKGSEGPLKDGELERATAWGDELRAKLTRR